MFGQVMSTVVDALLAIPPVRFVMGLVDAQWRPFWAALWLAAIAYILSRTMNHLALRRARLRILSEPQGSAADVTARAPRDAASSAPDAAAPTAKPSIPATAPRAASAAPVVPLPVVGGAVLVGAAVVIVTAVALRPEPNESAPSVPAITADSTLPSEASLDVRWRSGRMSDDDCVGTFEVTHGSGTRAGFVAFVMDSSGAVMARDSARVASAVAGLLVDFRFRHVDCDEIADWQLQATTPKAPSAAPAASR